MLNTNYSTDEPIWLCKQMCQGCGERVSPHTRQIVTVIQLSKVIGSQNLRYFHASHQLDLFFIKELAKQFHLKHKEELDSLIIHLLDKRVIFIVPSTSSKPCPRLSNHSLQRATTWRATFLDRRKDFRPICLDPVQSKTKHHIRQRYSQHTHSPRGGGGGGARIKRNQFKRTATSHHMFRESLSDSYTSHDFITTTLQPPTSIYGGFLIVPKVESTFPLNLHSQISTDLSVGVHAGTHPPAVPRSILDAFYNNLNHCIQSTSSHLLIRYDHIYI